MKYLISLILSIIIFPNHWIYGQNGNSDDLILLSGEVLDENGTDPLQDVHIYNRNNNRVTISDPSGFFSLNVSKFHVIRFTSVGYEPFYFSIPGDFQGEVYYVQIEMKKRTVPLRSVTIYGEEEKIESILSREEPDNPLEGVQLGTLQGESKPVEPSLENPVSMLWEWFSREGKEKRKLKAILKSERIRKAVNKRFDSELIWELTGLYGAELEKFKRYCNLPDEFVMYSNEYDFLLAVKLCYYKYKSQ